MNTEKYTRTSIQITEFESEDVITTSITTDEYELLNPTGGSKSMRQTK